MKKIDIIKNIIMQSDFGYHEQVKTGAVKGECGTYSHNLKLAIQGTIKEYFGVNIETQIGDAPHMSLYIPDPQEDITIDPTLAQFVPATKGSIFVGTKNDILLLFENNIIIDPIDGSVKNISPHRALEYLYGR